MRRGVSAEQIAVGLPAGIEAVRRPLDRMDWDDFAALCDRVQELLGDEVLEELGAEHVDSPRVRFIRYVVSLARTPAELFEIGQRWVARSVFLCVRSEVDQLPDGNLRVTLDIPAPYRGSEAFFRIYLGAMRAVPRCLGGDHVPVECEISARRAVYRIELPPALPRRGRLRRWLVGLLTRTSDLAEISLEHAAMRRSHDELTAVVADLEQRRDDLEKLVAEHTRALSGASEALRKEADERTAVQSELRRFIEYGMVVMDAVPGGILVLDETGIITFASRPALRLLGGVSADFVGRALHEVLGHATPGAVPCDGSACAITGVLREGVQCITPHEIFTGSNGRGVPVWWTSLPVRQDGRVVGSILFFSDITPMLSERRRRLELAARMRAAQRLESLGLMAGGVAHDFNNLLAVILGEIQLALEELPQLGRPRRHLQRALRGGRRAAELTRQMLVYAGRGALDPRALDLNELVRDNRSLLSAAIAKNVAIDLELHPELPAIAADRGQMQQVVMNLVLNAAQSIGPAGGRVSVSTRVREVGADEVEFGAHTGRVLDAGRYVELEVHDTGCGIAAADLRKVFDPFYTTRFDGRGLGLASVLGILRAHRAGIAVESEPALGTRFRVALPVSREAARPAAVRRVRRVQRSGGVLVIDDEDSVRALLEEALERAGFRVLGASDGETGAALLRERGSEIDVALVDLSMPGLGGPETVRELRRLRPELPVVLTSGYSEAEARERVACDRVTFLQKPFDVEDLVGLVSDALA